MPANRSDAARRAESIPNTRRAPHIGLPAQNRRTIPAPDGLSKVGRSATARRGPHRTDAAGSSDGLTVPRGFPLGDPDYRAAPGQPGDLEIDSTHDWAVLPSEGGNEPESGQSAPPPRATEGRVLRRVGTGRAPFRSAVLGGTLLVGVLGAGLAAWAISTTGAESDQGVVNQVEQPGPSSVVLSTPGTVVPGVTAGDVGAVRSSGAQPADPATAPADPAPPAAAGVITNSAVPPAANLGPATVSAIPPGDPGFGWPSTAFGLPPAPADQPAN